MSTVTHGDSRPATHCGCPWLTMVATLKLRQCIIPHKASYMMTAVALCHLQTRQRACEGNSVRGHVRGLNRGRVYRQDRCHVRGSDHGQVMSAVVTMTTAGGLHTRSHMPCVQTCSRPRLTVNARDRPHSHDPGPNRGCPLRPCVDYRCLDPGRFTMKNKPRRISRKEGQ